MAKPGFGAEIGSFAVFGECGVCVVGVVVCKPLNTGLGYATMLWWMATAFLGVKNRRVHSRFCCYTSPAPAQSRYDVEMDARGYLFMGLYVIPDLIWNLDMRLQKDLSCSKRGL